MHTKHSSCCKQDYDVLDALRAARERNCEGIGVTDHSNYARFNAGFVADQRAAVLRAGEGDRVLVGLEASIVDSRGRLGIHPKFDRLLDYKVIAEHLHVAKPFSEFHRVKHKIRKWYADPAKHAPRLRRFHAKHRLLYLNALKENPGTVLAHPFRFFRSRGLLDPVLLDLAEEVAQQAQESRVAIEVHGKFLAAANGEPSSHREFVLQMFRAFAKYDLKYALGSDAHRLERVGHFPRLEEALRVLGVPAERVVGGEHFRKRQT